MFEQFTRATDGADINNPFDSPLHPPPPILLEHALPTRLRTEEANVSHAHKMPMREHWRVVTWCVRGKAEMCWRSGI